MRHVKITACPKCSGQMKLKTSLEGGNKQKRWICECGHTIKKEK